MQHGPSAALFDMALQLYQSGRMAEAERTVRQAIAAEPAHVGALNLLAMIAAYAKQHQPSLEIAERALVVDPMFGPAYATRGAALSALGRPGLAIASFQRSVELDPGYGPGWKGLGAALAVVNNFDGAEDAYAKALTLDPNDTAARDGLAQAMQAQGRLDEAVEAFREAIAGAPQSAELHYNLGVALHLSGRMTEALGAYRCAVELKPDYFPAHSNSLLALNYLPGLSGEQLARHRVFDSQQTRGLPAAQTVWPNSRDADRRLRIGYVSGDFRVHPVGYYLLGPLEACDRSAFEVVCYSNNGAYDHVTGRIAQATDDWRDIAGLPDDQVVDLIHRDKIDILVDLSGHTDRNRMLLFARKPAPVQVSWLGYPGTTGMSAIDYLVMDASTIPPGSKWTTEAIVRLPNGRFCYSPPPYAPGVVLPPPRAGGAVVFGSFNNLAKIGPDVVRLWARVLDAVPRSRLIVKWMVFGLPEFRRRFEEAFAEAGVGPDRLELRGGSRHDKMLVEYADIDIALDTFPFCGGLTSSEALWMGVPVVTLPQDRVASRQTLAFLRGIGLDDLAAESEDDYVRIAAALAADPARRAELRRTLRPRMASSPMNDPKTFMSGLEAAYRQMWRRRCAGLPPAEITIG